jgi:hypothetical protein
MKNQFVNNLWITDVSSKDHIELFSFDEESVREQLLTTNVSPKDHIELFSFGEESV